jgi:hypothetical protein
MQIFQSALCVGIWGLRKRRSIAGLLPSELQAKNVNVLLYLFVSLFLIVMPWYVSTYIKLEDS